MELRLMLEPDPTRTPGEQRRLTPERVGGSLAPPTVSRVALVVAESSGCGFRPASTPFRCSRTSLLSTQWSRSTQRPWGGGGRVRRRAPGSRQPRAEHGPEVGRAPEPPTVVARDAPRPRSPPCGAASLGAGAGQPARGLGAHPGPQPWAPGAPPSCHQPPSWGAPGVARARPTTGLTLGEEGPDWLSGAAPHHQGPRDGPGGSGRRRVGQRAPSGAGRAWRGLAGTRAPRPPRSHSLVRPVCAELRPGLDAGPGPPGTRSATRGGISDNAAQAAMTSPGLAPHLQAAGDGEEVVEGQRVAVHGQQPQQPGGAHEQQQQEGRPQQGAGGRAG